MKDRSGWLWLFGAMLLLAVFAVLQYEWRIRDLEAALESVQERVDRDAGQAVQRQREIAARQDEMERKVLSQLKDLNREVVTTYERLTETQAQLTRSIAQVEQTAKATTEALDLLATRVKGDEGAIRGIVTTLKQVQADIQKVKEAQKVLEDRTGRMEDHADLNFSFGKPGDTPKPPPAGEAKP